MPKLRENINQLNSDIQAIKSAIVGSGVEIAEGTKIEEYADKVVEVYEAGKKAEWDAFWDSYQQDGAKLNYTQAFYSTRWNDINYKPKYPLICSSCQSMYNSSRISNTIQNIDISGCTNTQYLFGYVTTLITIPKLIVSESTPFKDTFISCSNLENLIIEGEVGQNGFNVQYSKKLNGKSIVSIIEALSSEKSGLTVTLSQTAKNNMTFPITSEQSKVTYDSWENLIATKSNWTISLV